MFLGLDISKNAPDVTLLGDLTKPRHKVFATTTGHQQLLKWLNGHGAVPVHDCLAATGTWGEAIVLSLHQTGHHVSVIKPLLIRGFSQSQLSHTKTDKADSLLIARFCQMHQPPLWAPPDPAIQELQALVRRLETLEEMRLMEENRLESGVSCATVRASLEEHTAYLQQQIEKTRRQIKDHPDQGSC